MARFRSSLPTAGMLALAMAFAATAPAQESAGGLVEVEDEAMLVEPFGLSIDEVEDLAVYGENGARMGEVEDVLAGAGGQIVAVAVEFDAFPGMGGREAVVGLDSLRLEGNRLVTGITEADAAALPNWQ